MLESVFLSPVLQVFVYSILYQEEKILSFA
jgi:hypothetical protein